jgi:diadenosine tetraphosphate (Ap4A) HIT family hydrolase
MNCALCEQESEVVVWRDGSCRVIAVDDPDYPGYCRVIWNEHAAEMTDLTVPAQRHLFNVVLATEAALRQLMQPDKINLASFGNMVPHLHWHIIPRFRDDRHFPQPVWGAAQRDGVRRAAPAAATLSAAIGASLTELTAG